MWVNAKVFMDLVAKLTILELKSKTLEERVETLEKRPLHLAVEESEAKADETVIKLYHELMNGVPDEKIGRVRYTDGRE